MGTYNKIYKHQNESCFYCNEKTDIDIMEKEHVFPRSKGGRGIKNKVLSCHYCNNLKGILTIDEFKILVEELLVNSNDEKLSKILITLNELNNGKEIRKDWHKKASYKSNDINKIPVK